MKGHLFLIIIIFTAKIYAQYTGHHQADTTKSIISNINEISKDTDHIMSYSFSRNLPMNRNGSGTSWQPDSTPIYAYMMHVKKWNLMFHGSIYLRYTSQDINKSGNRGGEKLDAPNWFMIMGQRTIGKKGLVNFNSMFSLDALTVRGEGYPLLFQTGESWKGKKLVDRQHPHDLFSELSVAYTYMVNKRTDITGYIGYPAQPAIGPSAFMHRMSAFNNSDAPLGHHWHDATHTTFGVVTLGFRYKKFKLEASRFTGREPDENRFNFDQLKFDSFTHRLSFNPTGNLSMQVSNAFIKSPEESEPEINILRTTASINYNVIIGKEKHLANTFIWGQNKANSSIATSCFLLESNLQVKKWALYGRYEGIEKTAQDLDLETLFDSNKKLVIHAITIGTNYCISIIFHTNLVIGLQACVFKTEESLNSIYGKYPMSAQAYIRINPGMVKTRSSKI